MKLAKSLDRLGTETALMFLQKAKKLEAAGKAYDTFRIGSDLILKHQNILLMQQKKL